MKSHHYELLESRERADLDRLSLVAAIIMAGMYANLGANAEPHCQTALMIARRLIRLAGQEPAKTETEAK